MEPKKRALQLAQEPEGTPARPGFPVVGIGASAGGLKALQRFFSSMPQENGMAFVVVLHLSPEHESHLAEILARSTAMPVVQVTQAVKLEVEHVYVIPPTHDLVMSNGQLRATPPQRVNGARIAVDRLFRTLADVHRERAFGIVLSGMGSDGAAGLVWLKERGGVTMAQAPQDAEFDSMPKAAIATGMADIVLPAADMPQRLLDLWRNAIAITLPGDEAAAPDVAAADGADAARQAEVALADITTLLRQQTKHDFQHYKRATVLRRIERRLQVLALPNLVAYRDYMRGHAEEAGALLQDLLISVTNFFRDPEAFLALEREAIRGLFEGRSADDPVRVWVAGCATGEEAYSVAMLLREASAAQHVPVDFQVFATDIDERALAIARAALYTAGIVADVTPARLSQFFNKEGEQYRVVKSLREKVLFAQHNLLRDPPFSRLDLICCRNLLIYLERRAQINILEMFGFALKARGLLFLGTSESVDPSSPFMVIDKKHRLFRSTKIPSGSQPFPMLPKQPAMRDAKSSSKEVIERRRPAASDIHLRALEQFMPPSLLLDEKHNIVNISERAGKFLQPAAGEPSKNVLSNLSAELRMELRTLLYKASQTGQSETADGIRLESGGQTRRVRLTVCPFRSADDVRFTLAVFEELHAPALEDRVSADEVTKELVLQMEGELAQLKLQVQQTVEQAEASTEELKASNEELQAINEELRSASEELETSKEELQSLNEELITVNQELKAKVEETDQVNDDLQNLIASTDIATVFVDGQLRIKRFTPQAQRLFNLIESDLGRSLLDITHKLDYPEMGEDAQRAYNLLRVTERTVRSREGGDYLARFLPYRTVDSKISGAVLTFIDVTALKTAEEMVRQGEKRLRLAAQTSSDFAIVTMDEQGRITAWNAGAQRLFGYTDTEAAGRDHSFLFTPEDQDNAIPAQLLRGARQTGKAQVERWYMHQDGSKLFCSGVLTALGEDGVGFAWIARDITGSKEQEAARDTLLAQERQVRRQAQASNRLKDEFLAVMSHELKHPLNLIHVNAELLMRVPEAQPLPAVKRAGETIRQAAANQAMIIDDLLDLSRINTGKLKLQVQPLDLRNTVEPIVNAASGDAQARGIKLSLVCESDPLVVVADLVRVEQITWNLLNNALKFNVTGGSVSVTLAQEGEFARMQVSDTGQGIEPKFLPHIFEIFSQEPLGYSSKNRGLGIGLALVRDLAELHGGRVEAYSSGIGHGATFTVWLPLNNRALTAAATPDREPSSMSGLHVLLVDDSPETLDAFAQLLRLGDMVVDVADSGALALQKLQQVDYDLVLSDLGMPEMDGYEFIARVRADPRGAKLPAIALSGFGREADVQRALTAGFDTHVSKPASLTNLRAAWNRLRTTSAAGAEPRRR